MIGLGAAALIAGVPALIKGIGGWLQHRKGKKMAAANVRPDFPTNLERTVPESVKQATAVFEGMTRNQDLPGGDIFRNQVWKGVSKGMSSLREAGPGAILAGTQGLVQGAQDTFGGMQANLMQQIEAAKVGYGQALGVEGQYEAQAEDFKNQLALQKHAEDMGQFQQTAAAASAMKGAGLQNMFGAASDIAGIGATSYLGAKNPNMYSGLYGGGYGGFGTPWGANQFNNWWANTGSQQAEQAGSNFSIPNMFAGGLKPDTRQYALGAPVSSP